MHAWPSQPQPPASIAGKYGLSTVATCAFCPQPRPTIYTMPSLDGAQAALHTPNGASTTGGAPLSVSRRVSGSRFGSRKNYSSWPGGAIRLLRYLKCLLLAMPPPHVCMQHVTMVVLADSGRIFVQPTKTETTTTTTTMIPRGLAAVAARHRFFSSPRTANA